MCHIDQVLQTGNVELLQQIATEQKYAYQGSAEKCIGTIVLQTFTNIL